MSLVDKRPRNECGQMMTWEDFKTKFSKYHAPQGLIKKMRDEFRELKQGRMFVVEYRDRFLTLSRYAPDETYTNEKRKERFLNGLHDEMQTVLVNIPFADLEALVDSAIQMEGKLHQANENRKRPPKPGGNNNNNHNNNTNPNSNNNNNGNNNNNAGPRTGSNAIPVATKDKATITCYECGVVGHYSNECPKRLAKIAANTAAPAQNQRRFAARRNQNNNNGRLYNMTATEAQEARQAMTSYLSIVDNLALNLAADRRSPGTPSDPVGSPEKPRHLVGDDDAYASTGEYQEEEGFYPEEEENFDHLNNQGKLTPLQALLLQSNSLASAKLS
ncbi:hypothetical protein QYE76_035269 [Lolium multiflorum]|uniref:CCHC-type domain-containing protein n=1 Tax=Lolium multiflorum TaxID=4521 RepID=A0AAD8QZD3_LOLMU|nr:hypothetical protein QYE76_035269 [Lolium multiflorum]